MAQKQEPLTTWNGNPTFGSNTFGARRIHIRPQSWVLYVPAKTFFLLFQFVAANAGWVHPRRDCPGTWAQLHRVATHRLCNTNSAKNGHHEKTNNCERKNFVHCLLVLIEMSNVCWREKEKEKEEYDFNCVFFPQLFFVCIYSHIKLEVLKKGPTLLLISHFQSHLPFSFILIASNILFYKVKYHDDNN